MSNSIRFALTVLIALTLGRNAEAVTIYGPSGLILNPSAYVPPANAFGFGVTTFTTKKAGAEKTWISGAADLGLGGRAEIGATFLQRTNSKTDSGFGGFAKYQFLKETPGTPAVSAGVDLIGGDLKTQQAYVVATKGLTTPLKFPSAALTAGVIYSWDRDGKTRDDADTMAGLAFGITPSLNLIGEWRSKTKGNIHDSSGVAVMYGGRNYSIAVGALNNGASDDLRFFVGAGFNVSTVD
ncbi:MAG: hypothetical protein ACREJQ_00930 [bacterium]